MLITAKIQEKQLNFHNRCMGQQILIFLYYRILFRNKKEKNISICNNTMNLKKSRKDIIHKKLHATWIPICEVLEKAKIRPQITDCWGQGLRERTGLQNRTETSRVMEMFSILSVVVKHLHTATKFIIKLFTSNG